MPNRDKADFIIGEIQGLKDRRARAYEEKRAALEKIKRIQRDEVTPLVERIDELSDKIGVKQDELNGIQKAPRVSDHAVIRYLERKHGFSFEEVRDGLLTQTVKQAMEVGASAVKVDGMTLKIRGNCVTTVVVS